MPKRTSTSKSDCRSPEGITVGLIDSIITAARVLSYRQFTHAAVLEALKDLREDSDVKRLLGAYVQLPEWVCRKCDYRWFGKCAPGVCVCGFTQWSKVETLPHA